jgi:hypothetical protein
MANKKVKIIDKLNEEKRIKNLVYVNHNVNTYKSERVEPYEILTNKKNYKTLL